MHSTVFPVACPVRFALISLAVDVRMREEMPCHAMPPHRKKETKSLLPRQCLLPVVPPPTPPTRRLTRPVASEYCVAACQHSGLHAPLSSEPASQPLPSARRLHPPTPPEVPAMFCGVLLLLHRLLGHETISSDPDSPSCRPSCRHLLFPFPLLRPPANSLGLPLFCLCSLPSDRTGNLSPVETHSQYQTHPSTRTPYTCLPCSRSTQLPPGIYIHNSAYEFASPRTALRPLLRATRNIPRLPTATLPIPPQKAQPSTPHNGRTLSHRLKTYLDRRSPRSYGHLPFGEIPNFYIRANQLKRKKYSYLLHRKYLT